MEEMRQKNEGGDMVLVAGLVVRIVLVFGTQFPLGKNKKEAKAMLE
jgi:hypothetical protein